MSKRKNKNNRAAVDHNAQSGGAAAFSHWSQHWRSTHAVAWTSTPTGLCSMA